MKTSKYSQMQLKPDRPFLLSTVLNVCVVLIGTESTSNTVWLVLMTYEDTSIGSVLVRRMSSNAAERDRQCIYHSFRIYSFIVLFQISEIRHMLYTIACSMFRSNCWLYDCHTGSYRSSDVSSLSYRKGGSIFQESPAIQGKRDSIVDIAIGYMPDVSGFETRWEQEIFSSQSSTKSALEPILTPAQWARRLILEVKQSVRAVDHLPLSDAEVQIG